MRRYLSAALIIVLLSVVGLPAALTRAQDAAKPVISVKVEGKESKGVAGSYCWTTENPPCDVVDSPEPKAEIIVKPGDPIEFVIAPAPEKLDSFKATLLDDLDASGNPISVDLAASKNIYTVAADLKPGKHRIQAEAAYPADASGSQNFVFYAFLLNVQTGAVAVAPTNAAATAAVTTEATLAATIAATPGATTEATIVATVSATTVATIAATEVTIVPTQAATANATVAATTAATQAATVGATTAVTAATQAATIAPTATPIPNSPTPIPTLTSTPIPTVVPPTVAPTTVPRTIVPPTATPVPLPAATQPGASGLPSPDTIVPPMTLTIGSTEYKPIAIEGCEVRTGGLKICVSGPVNTNARLAEGTAGSDAIYIFKGMQPSEVKLVTFGADGTKPITQTTAPAGNVVLITLPTTPGTYVLSIEVAYPTGRATYFFRVSLKK